MYGLPYCKPGGLSDGSVKCPYYEAEDNGNGNSVRKTRKGNGHQRVSGR
jgi:hypothetical protein